MGSAAGEDEALSDLEDDVVPVVLSASAAVSNTDTATSVLAELESERQARKAAEAAKLELKSKFTRLKTYTQEAVRQRDEAVRHREEAQKSKEELVKQLNEVVRHRDELAQLRDDAVKAKHDISWQKDDASRARDASRAEIEVAARLLVEGAERITARAVSIKTFPVNLPRSSSHSGLAAIAYGYIKRTEEIVDELVRHQEIAVKSRSEMHQQMEQRNYQVAIELSELEASLQRLNNELLQRSLEADKWQKTCIEKEGMISAIEKEMSHRLAEAEKETEVLKNVAHAAESKIEKLKASIRELSQLISKTDETLANLTDSITGSQTLPANKSLSHSSIRCEPEEGLQGCISMMKETVAFCGKLVLTWKEHRAQRKKEMDDLEGTITRLIIEKKEITNFLRSALANKQEVLEAVSKSNVENNQSLNTATKNWESKTESIVPDLDRNRLFPGIVSQSRQDGSLGDEFKTGEAISMASALENEVRNLRQEIFELQQFLAVARGEVEWLRVTSERQTKELSEKSCKIQEFEEKLSLSQENIEGLQADLSAAEEEVLCWKQAATKEAEAGAVVLEELERCQEEITVFREQIKQLRQSLEDSNIKLHSKEEMAIAAIAAQNAAERSLRIADERAVDLRERIEEMTRQFESLEGSGDGPVNMGLFEMCWPNKWFSSKQSSSQQDRTARSGAEMEELLDPLV